MDGWINGFAEWIVGSTVSLSGWLGQRVRRLDGWITDVAERMVISTVLLSGWMGQQFRREMVGLRVSLSGLLD